MTRLTGRGLARGLNYGRAWRHPKSWVGGSAVVDTCYNAKLN